MGFHAARLRSDLSNLGTTAIARALLADSDAMRDLGNAAQRWDDLFAESVRTGDTAADTLKLVAYDTGSETWTPFMTLTAGNPATADLAANVTLNGESIVTGPPDTYFYPLQGYSDTADYALHDKTPVAEYEDDTANVFNRWVFRVPTGYSGISSITVHYLQPTPSDKDVVLSYYVSRYRDDAPYANDSVTNQTITLNSHASSGTTLGGLTVSAAAYNGLSIGAGDIVSFSLERDSNAGADTLNAVWRVFGITVVYS